MPPIKIIFAVDSPLYAPVHLALALSKLKRPGFDGFEAAWTVSGPPKMHPVSTTSSQEVTIGPEQSNTESTSKCPDQLVARITKETPRDEDRNFVCLGVGDPMRLATVLGSTSFHAPRVVGCLISKMCYWALDGKTTSHFNNSNHDLSYLKVVSKVFVHPIGMTGYAVPFYHLTHILEEEPVTLEQRFREVGDATRDSDDYDDALKHYLEGGAKEKPPAYVTANPMLGLIAAEQADWEVQEVSLLHDYSTNRRFEDTVMTAFLTNEKVLADPESLSVLREFLAALAIATEMLDCERELASAILYRFSRSIHAAGRPGFACYSRLSPETIGAILKFIMGRKIYPSHRDIKPKQWERSIEIARPAGSCIHSVNRNNPGRGVESLAYKTYVVTI